MSLVANLFFFITDEIKLIAKIFFFIAVNPHEAKLTYKEDTKLEDRLAMEAEEELVILETPISLPELVKSALETISYCPLVQILDPLYSSTVMIVG